MRICERRVESVHNIHKMVLSLHFPCSLDDQRGRESMEHEESQTIPHEHFATAVLYLPITVLENAQSNFTSICEQRAILYYYSLLHSGWAETRERRKKA